MKRLLLVLWVLPATVVGLLLALPLLVGGARAVLVDGVLEISGGRLAARLPRRHVLAITLGHVVLGRSAEILLQWRKHEHAHVRQYERWGVLFFPLYLGSSLLAWLRGGDAYLDNVFERDAREAERR